MGLDIYFYKVKETEENKELFAKEGWTEVVGKEADKQAKKVFSDAYKKMLKALKKVDGTDKYNTVYVTQVKKLAKLCGYPQFDLQHLGVSYDWNTHKYCYTSMPYVLVEHLYNEILSHFYAKSVAYFRKVNFIYRFFSHKLEDECAWVTKDDVEELIINCNQVLADHSLADELLPTVGGFFFGSTEYDDMYFSDVKDCKEQMEKMLKVFDDSDYKVYVVMSW